MITKIEAQSTNYRPGIVEMAIRLVGLYSECPTRHDIQLERIQKASRGPIGLVEPRVRTALLNISPILRC